MGEWEWMIIKTYLHTDTRRTELIELSSIYPLH